MKRTVMAFACFALVSIAVKAQMGQIVLHHQGAVSVFANDKMEDAMTKAVDGDTIYLSEGTFSSAMNITKKVSVIGAGYNTVYLGTINIDIPGEPTLTARLLDAMDIQAVVEVKQACKGMVIRKCKFRSIVFSALTEDATIDRCWCFGTGTNGFKLSNNIKGMIVLNSRVRSLSGDASSPAAINFMHCNIKLIYNVSGASVFASYTNCIIAGWNYTDSYFYTNTVFRYCLCGKSYYSKSDYNNCWNYNNTDILNDNCYCSVGDADLQAKGYIGNDGTVVGCTGGENPYTLTPAVPRVTEHTITVDTEKKELNVNIKVTTN